MRPSCRHLYLSVFFLLVVFAPSAAAEYRQISAAIDVRTVYSDGDLTVEGLVRLARKRGFQAVFFSDHDRLVMEYGLFPLRHLIKRRESLNSIHQMGAGAYLSDIREAARRHPDMVLIPGCESAPYYYWTGSYFTGDLTAHDHEKRLLALGLDRAEDYEDMPVVHNGFSFRYIGTVAPRLLLFAGAFIIGVMMFRESNRLLRTSGIFLCAAALLLAINTMPFRSSPFDPYMGEKGIAPYQLYIDYVTSRGGMVFWNYPETHAGVRPLGPIRLDTPPYPEVLEAAAGYTGFAAVYGDTSTVTEPGREWDRVLLAYCRGQRQRPVWGIATADYHSEKGAGGALGNFPTVLLVEEMTEKGVLQAMRVGRMYAVQGRYPQRLVLDEFTASGKEQEERVVLGQEIDLETVPEIRISVSAKVPTESPVSVRLIRGGDVIGAFQATLPFRAALVDEKCPRGEKTYYRLDVRGKETGILVSNPVFVTVRRPG
jgi:hypothetical protein